MAWKIQLPVTDQPQSTPILPAALSFSEAFRTSSQLFGKFSTSRPTDLKRSTLTSIDGVLTPIGIM